MTGVDNWGGLKQRHRRGSNQAAVSPLSDIAAICIAANRPLFDHLVGEQLDRIRDAQTKRFRGLQIDHQLEFRGL